MYSKTWQVIKDDTKRTFEVCGSATNTNAFMNETYAMQRVGMNVSCVTPPVSNKESSKELVKINGYTKEDGLYNRLQLQYKQIVMKSYEDY
ncbi:MAG TPA: hypothetical protein VFE50_21010 [Cyclobacteriaceae bacterium]|nr:hypothetical protein [Cyclobacteriaceae bacterium]